MNKRDERRLQSLDDYLRGHDLADAAPVDAFEEDLFARALAGDAPELVFRLDAQATLRDLKARGVASPWITASDVERVRASGLSVVVVEASLEANVQLEIPDGVDVIVTRIPLDLADVERLDVEVTRPDGRLVKLMPEVPFDRADGAIFACCDVDLARKSMSTRTVTRAYAIEDGKRRLIAEATAGLPVPI